MWGNFWRLRNIASLQKNSWLQSAAAAAVAGTAAATTTTDRVAGGDSKTGAWPCFDVFNLDRAAGVQQALFNEELEVIVIVHFIVVFWLIQSQSQ